MLDKDISLLQKNEWEYHSLNIVLAKNDNSICYKGPGTIKQDLQGKLKFILYDATYDWQKDLKSGKSGLMSDNAKAGEIIVDAEQYTLTADDLFSENIINPCCDYTHGKTGAVVKGKIHVLIKKDDYSHMLEAFKEQNKTKKYNPYYFNTITVKYIFFDDFDYPVNTVKEKETKIGDKTIQKSSGISVSEFSSCGYNFRIEKENGRIIYTINSVKEVQKFTDKIEFRAIEALKFILGDHLDWQIKIKHEYNSEITYIKPFISPKKGQNSIGKPVAFSIHASFSNIKRLFDSFLKFTMKNNDDDYHPLSTRINSLIDANDGYWSTVVITLCIQVEGIIKDYFEEDYKPDKKNVDEFKMINVLLQEKIDSGELKVSEEVNKRIFDSINYQINQKPVKAILSDMIKEHSIRELDAKAWNKLRHKSAHGIYVGFDQKALNNKYKILMLFYSLVFKIIGFKGEIIDYGNIGFPKINYPYESK